jgi:hypothetical protein
VVKREASSAPRPACRWIAIFAAVFLACGSGSWVSAAPVALRSDVTETDLIVARCVQRARELGYTVDSVDYQQGSVRLLSFRSDAVRLGFRLVPRSSSWVLVQVEDDHTVTLRAYGDLVKEGDARMHPELRAEMDWLAEEFEKAIGGALRTSEEEPG